MADGSIIIDTKLNTKGVESGISGLKSKFGTLGTAGVNAMGLITKAIAAVGTGLITLTGAAIKVGAEFEASMSKVEAISGATGKELEALTEKAKEMGIKTKFSAKESADAFYYMAQAGWKTQDMLNGIEGVMNLAAAAETDLATTSDIVTDALTAFGLKAGEATHFADVLARASADTNTDVLKMGETFKYVGPLAGAMGYSIEDVSVAIGLMANSGIKASQAGTSLRSIISRLAKPTDELQMIMDKFGISLMDTEGNAKPFREVLEQLRSSMKGLSEEEKVANAAVIAGKPGMSGMLAILNATDEEFNNLTQSLDNCSGAAEEMAEVMQDNLKGQLEILKSSAEGLGLEIYESIENPLKEAVKVAIGYVEQLGNAFKKGGFTGMSAEIGNIMSDIVSKLVANAPKIIEASVATIQAFITGIENNSSQIAQGTVSIITTLANSIIEMTPQLIMLGINIITELIKGMKSQAPTILQSGIDAIISLAEGISNEMPTLIPLMIDLVLELVDTLLNNIDALIDAGIDLIIGITVGITQALPKIAEKAPDIILKLLVALIKNVPKLIGASVAIIEQLGNGIDQFKERFSNRCKELINMAKQAIINKVTEMAEVGANLVKGLWNGIRDKASWLKNKISGWVDDVVGAIKDFFGINSPSRVMRDEIGVFLSKGIAVGFDKDLSNTEKNMGSRIKSMVSKMQGVVAMETGNLTAKQVVNADRTISTSNTIHNKINNNIEVTLEAEGRVLAKTIAPYTNEFDKYEIGR